LSNKEIPSQWKVPLYKIYTDDEDVQIITKIIKRGTQWAIGPEVDEFENLIKNYVGCDYCASLNSGTSALHATFLAYDFTKNNEIIVPSFSFISTANAVLFVGAKPVFSDIEDQTFGLDPLKISKKITSNTKAIVPMDYGGLPCKIFDLQKIAKDNNLVLIEDAAESLGSSIQNKKIGSIADSSIFSFCGNKVLTTGEGGAVVTNSKKIFEKIKLIRSHGRYDVVNYFNNPQSSEHLQLGYNWRMSSITAALGISQLQKLDKIIRMRRMNADFLSSHFKNYEEICLPNPPNGHNHIYQMYTIRLKTKQIRDSLHNFLLQKGIFSKVYFNPIHLTDFYINNFGTSRGMLPVTEKVSDEVLTLPLYPNMTYEEKNYLVNSISEFFEQYRH